MNAGRARAARFTMVVLALFAASPLIGVTLAQERTETPRGRTTCTNCGADRDPEKPDAPCGFCGRSEQIVPQKRNPAPTGGRPSRDYPGPTAPGPAAPPPSDPKPAKDPGTVKDVEPVPAEEEGTDARSRAYRDENVAKGDYFMKTGYYLKASEAYRVAVLEDPANPWKKLSFGHALFAIGNYSYASYALRRAVSQLDQKEAFNPDTASLFPSKRAFEKALKDLKRYVTYSPRDPAGLSVLGYVLYGEGENERAKEMFVYLQKLPKNEADPFAAFFLKQLEGRKDRPVAEAAPVAPPPPPPPPPAQAAHAPEAARQDEEPARIKPVQGAALAE